MVVGLQKYSGSRVRQRGSSPKLLVLNTALMTAMSGRAFSEAKADREFWGRLVESVVGAHLADTGHAAHELYYWRERNREVDYVVRAGRNLMALEVASGRRKDGLPGMEAFRREFGRARPLLVGTGGMPLEDFLLTDPADLVSS